MSTLIKAHTQPYEILNNFPPKESLRTTQNPAILDSFLFVFYMFGISNNHS
jgi:hypothetical protein